MTYRTFVALCSCLLLGFWLVVIVNVVQLPSKLKVLTYHDVYTGMAGPSGLVKDMFIKSYYHDGQPHLIRKGSDTTRSYSGLTLSKFLLPINAINHARVVTFYGLVSANKKEVTHFAATAGTQKASALRLGIDIWSYCYHKWCALLMLALIVNLNSERMFKWFNKSRDVSGQISEIEEDPKRYRLIFPLLMFSLFLMFI